MKVALLTMFSGLSATYSLVGVVAEQLEMLLTHSIDVKLIVTENCPPAERHGIFLDERIEWVFIKNKIDGKTIISYDYSNPTRKLHDSFYDEADFFAAQFAQALSDVDVCIMHDILYQGAHYVHNIAIRKAQKELPNVRFLAFAHSFPMKRPLPIDDAMAGRYTPMEHTLFIYPCYSGIMHLAQQYHVPEARCRVVYNSAPILSTLHHDVKKLHNQVNLFNSDYLIIYPGRLTTGKKFEKVAALAGTIKRLSERPVKLIFCDFPSSDIPCDEYKDAIYYVGEFYGLEKADIVFTSDQGYPHGFPREGVLDLFMLSNLFICPSFSEAFSLTVLEAASRGNFLVLNECVPGLEEAGKLLGAYFMKWDARNLDYNITQHYKPSERQYYELHAAEIIRLMREDRVCLSKTMIRKRFNSDWVWENQLGPLLETE